jgi:hypothetical protein
MLFLDSKTQKGITFQFSKYFGLFFVYTKNGIISNSMEITNGIVQYGLCKYKPWTNTNKSISTQEKDVRQEPVGYRGQNLCPRNGN